MYSKDAIRLFKSSRYSIINGYVDKLPKREIYHEFYDLDSLYNGSVYIMYSPVTNMCKIGISKNVTERKRTIDLSSGVRVLVLIELELELNYDEKPIHVEKYLHRFFKHKKSFGEWYDLDLRDLLLIRMLFHKIEGYGIIDNYKFYSDVLFQKLFNENLKKCSCCGSLVQ